MGTRTPLETRVRALGGGDVFRLPDSDAPDQLHLVKSISSGGSPGWCLVACMGHSGPYTLRLRENERALLRV